MNEVNGLPMVINNQEPAVKEPAQMVVLEDKPDTFTKSNKTVTGVLLAGGVATSAGVAAYQRTKAFAGKVIDKIEKEFGSYLKELHKGTKDITFTISNKIKVNTKYGAALLAGIGAALIVFKDSDKDGKLDILEAIQKYTQPNS